MITDRAELLKWIAEDKTYQAVMRASKDLLDDRKLVSLAVKKNGMALEYASRALKADKELVSIAVAEDRRALQYASKEIKADREVVLLAVQQDHRSLLWASPEIQALCQDKDPVKVLKASILADELKAEMKPKPKIDNKPKRKI